MILKEIFFRVFEQGISILSHSFISTGVTAISTMDSIVNDIMNNSEQYFLFLS